jgi:hypothetical protein
MKNKSMLFDLTRASVIGLLAILPSLTTYAATSATINATVTVQNISVSVSDGTVTYGTLATSTTQDTTSSGLNDSQTATNNGNVGADLNIRGQNTTNWTLAGTVGEDQYKHEYCTSDCDSSPVWSALTTNNQTLSSGLAASGTSDFDLKLSTPTTSSSYTQQSVDVVVQASAI